MQLRSVQVNGFPLCSRLYHSVTDLERSQTPPSGLNRESSRPDRVVEGSKHRFSGTRDQRDRDDFLFKVRVDADLTCSDLEVCVLALDDQWTEVLIVWGDSR